MSLLLFGASGGGGAVGSFVGADANGGNVTAITLVTWPAVQSGDLAILVWTFQNTLTPTDPTSQTFTLVATADDPSCRSRVLKRVCDGTESGDISGWSMTINRQSAVLYVVRGFSDVAGAVSFAETTAGTTHDCPSIGTGDGAANGDSIVVAVSERLTSGTTNATAPTSPVTFAEHAGSEFGTGGSGGTYTGVADDGLATSQTMPFDPGAWSGHVSGSVAVTWTLALRPSGGTTFNQSVAGSVTPAGAVTKQAGKPLAGAISPAGTQVKQTNKAVAGTTASAGTLLKTTVKRFTGAVTPSSALANALVRLLSLAGAVTPAGVLLKQANKILSGAATPTGAATKQPRKTFAGAVAPASVVANIKTILLALAGAITPAGTLIRQTRRALGGTVAPAGAVLKQTAKRFTGALTPAGAAANTRLAFLAVAGTIAPAGALAKRVAKALGGTINPTGALLKLISRTLGGTVAPAGASTHTVDIPQDNGTSTPVITGPQSATQVTGVSATTTVARRDSSTSAVSDG